MKKLVNIRPALIAAIGMGAGAGLGFACCYYSLPVYWMIAIVPVTALFLVIFIVKGKAKFIALTAVTAVLFTVGFFGIRYKINDYADKQLTGGTSYLITGTVAEKGFTDGGEYIKIKNATADGVQADGRMYVYLDYDYGDYCEVGYTVSFTGTVYLTEAFAYGEVSSTRLIENVRYTVYPEGNISSEYGFTVLGSVNIKMRELLFDNFDSDVATVAYGMLTGNTEYVETGTMEFFRYGGVAHVFAVSGLHIGLVFAAVTFILKKCHLNRYLVALLSVILIFLYSGVCGFTLSSVRAAIMCTVMLAVKLSGGKYDSLSAISIAFIVIVLINPLNVISAGFQMSVAAVTGIALLSGVIKRGLAKIKILRKIASSIAVAVSAQAGTFPILLATFGYVSWASLFMNIIFVPILSALFTLLFVCMVLALIIQPIASVFLFLPSACLGGVMGVIAGIKAEAALISGFEFGALVPLYYAVFLFLSDKINFSKRVRIAVFAISAAVVTFAMVVANYVPSGRLKITASAWYGDSSAVLLQTENSNVLVICETPSTYDISSLLQHGGATYVDTIIILGDDDSIFAYTLCGQTCENIYVNYTNFPVQPYSGVTVHYSKSFEIDGVSYTFVDYGNLLAEYDGITIGITMYGEVAFSSCNLLISEIYTSYCKTDKTVYFRNVSGYDNIYSLGDLQFIVKNGKLYGNR